MITRKDIQATCDDIVREFAPLQVILFGSYAYGTPTEDSDVDLLVIMDIPESETREQASKIYQRIPRRFPMDVLVRSPEEIVYRVSYNDWFLREITEKGEVLHGPKNLFTRISEKKRDAMNELTLEWIQKAERDYAAIELHQQTETPDSRYNLLPCPTVYRKILKSVASRSGHPFSKTHDLEGLLDLIVPTIPSWRAWQSDFRIIAPYSVEFRYPGKSATAEHVQHAVHICTEVRQAVQAELNPPQNRSERGV